MCEYSHMASKFYKHFKRQCCKNYKNLKSLYEITVKKCWNAKCIKLPYYRYKENVNENLQNLFKKYFKISFFGR